MLYLCSRSLKKVHKLETIPLLLQFFSWCLHSNFKSKQMWRKSCIWLINEPIDVQSWFKKTSTSLKLTYFFVNKIIERLEEWEEGLRNIYTYYYEKCWHLNMKRFYVKVLVFVSKGHICLLPQLKLLFFCCYSYFYFIFTSRIARWLHQ